MPDGSLPVQYQNVLKPIATLTYVAANTERISLGTTVLDMLFHNPVILAKQLATLDLFSGGRVIVGLGLGWSQDEYEASGISYKQKGARADEYLQVLKRIWTDFIVEFYNIGEFYNIPASKIAPKPVQKPHPTILLGGFSPKTFSRILSYADGWIGAATTGPLEQFDQIINGLRDAVRKVGKDPSKVDVFITFPNVPILPASYTQTRLPMTGTIYQIGSDIEQIKEMGVKHIIFGYMFLPLGRNMEEMIEIIKQFARFPKRRKKKITI